MFCRLCVQSSVIQGVADAVAEISVVLRNTDVSAAGSTNSFGDDQLQVKRTSQKQRRTIAAHVGRYHTE
jgi:hypothetical protein